MNKKQITDALGKIYGWLDKLVGNRKYRLYDNKYFFFIVGIYFEESYYASSMATLYI